MNGKSPDFHSGKRLQIGLICEPEFTNFASFQGNRVV